MELTQCLLCSLEGHQFCFDSSPRPHWVVGWVPQVQWISLSCAMRLYSIIFLNVLLKSLNYKIRQPVAIPAFAACSTTCQVFPYPLCGISSGVPPWPWHRLTHTSPVVGSICPHSTCKEMGQQLAWLSDVWLPASVGEIEDDPSKLPRTEGTSQISCVYTVNYFYITEWSSNYIEVFLSKFIVDKLFSSVERSRNDCVVKICFR